VPQGTAFSLTILRKFNCVALCSFLLTIRQYIVYSEKTWDRLEEQMNVDLGRMRIWMQRNKLLIHAKKSCYVTFGYSVNPDICIRIGDDVLGHVDSL
jgi:hypothetical protein